MSELTSSGGRQLTPHSINFTLYTNSKGGKVGFIHPMGAGQAHPSGFIQWLNQIESRLFYSYGVSETAIRIPPYPDPESIVIGDRVLPINKGMRSDERNE